MDILQSIHKSFISFNKRAERSSEAILVSTFVDCAPLYDLLRTEHNQVIYGRRGTGKTHALKYLGDQIMSNDVYAIYIDLRSIGSNGSIYNDPQRPLPERACSLILDVLNTIYIALYEVSVIAIDRVQHPEQITTRLDDFGAELTRVRVTGSIERENTTAASQSGGLSASIEGGIGSALSGAIKLEGTASGSNTYSLRTTASGAESVYLNFANIMSALSGLLKVVGLSRLWILIDEWSEVPFDLQPYLADLLRRTILPISEITIKIAAIEHRSNFVISRGRGEYIGLELGADVAADLNLDDFLVFDNDQQRWTTFFKNLIFKHFRSTDGAVAEIESPDQLIQIAFTQLPVFEEFVRTVEGVPRDALNLAAKIATKSFGRKTTMQDVRDSARDWYQQDKAAVIRSNEPLEQLLTHIVRSVIGRRRARAFLLQNNIKSDAIDQLFDARILHALKRNISSRDEPGARYDVYKIDYGCYVELINTTQAPAGLFQVDDGEFAEVPRDDYRSIRRAILESADLMAPPF